MKNHGDRPRWSNYNEINLSFTVASIPGLLNQRQMDHRYTRARFGSILKRKSFALAFCLVSSPHQYFVFLPCLSKCAHCLFFWRNNSNDDSIEQLAFLHSRMKSNISFRLQFGTIFFNPKVMIYFDWKLLSIRWRKYLKLKLWSKYTYTFRWGEQISKESKITRVLEKVRTNAGYYS